MEGRRKKATEGGPPGEEEGGGGGSSARRDRSKLVCLVLSGAPRGLALLATHSDAPLRMKLNR